MRGREARGATRRRPLDHRQGCHRRDRHIVAPPGVPRLEALVGSGVFYGAAGSEMRAMEGGHVFVMGAGNSAGQTTLHLARHAHR